MRHMPILPIITCALLSSCIQAPEIPDRVDAKQPDAEIGARVSVAEAEGIRLEVRQVPFHQALDIRVSDFWARNHRRAAVQCSVFHHGQADNAKIADVELTWSDAGYYQGQYTNEHEHVHGTAARVEYSESLEYPISTWIHFYYH